MTLADIVVDGVCLLYYVLAYPFHAEGAKSILSKYFRKKDVEFHWLEMMGQFAGMVVEQKLEEDVK